MQKHAKHFAVPTLFIVVILLSYQSANARGNFAEIVVSGGQLSSGIEVTDPSLLEFSSFSEFYKQETRQPKTVGEGYVVTRYEQYQDGTFHAWDRLHYYPNNSGWGGFVHYEGLINGWSEYDGKWYFASANGDAAMRRTLVSQNSKPLFSDQWHLLLAFPALVLATGVGAFFIRTRKWRFSGATS